MIDQPINLEQHVIVEPRLIPNLVDRDEELRRFFIQR